MPQSFLKPTDIVRVERVEAFKLKEELPTSINRSGAVQENGKEEKRSKLPEYQKLIQYPNKFVKFCQFLW